MKPEERTILQIIQDVYIDGDGGYPGETAVSSAVEAIQDLLTKIKAEGFLSGLKAGWVFRGDDNEKLIREVIKELDTLKKVSDLCSTAFEKAGEIQKAEHWVGQSNGLMKAKLLISQLL